MGRLILSWSRVSSARACCRSAAASSWLYVRWSCSSSLCRCPRTRLKGLPTTWSIRLTSGMGYSSRLCLWSASCSRDSLDAGSAKTRCLVSKTFESSSEASAACATFSVSQRSWHFSLGYLVYSIARCLTDLFLWATVYGLLSSNYAGYRLGFISDRQGFISNLLCPLSGLTHYQFSWTCQ